MLALFGTLQACTEASGSKTGILCETARELQQCMVPLMTLIGDNVVEASLLRSTGDELGPFPTPEEETALLVSWAKKMGIGSARPYPRHSENSSL